MNAFNAVVKSRNSSYERWGFKAPFRNHWDLLEGLPMFASSPSFVIFSRSPTGTISP